MKKIALNLSDQIVNLVNIIGKESIAFFLLLLNISLYLLGFLLLFFVITILEIFIIAVSNPDLIKELSSYTSHLVVALFLLTIFNIFILAVVKIADEVNKIINN